MSKFFLNDFFKEDKDKLKPKVDVDSYKVAYKSSIPFFIPKDWVLVAHEWSESDSNFTHTLMCYETPKGDFLAFVKGEDGTWYYDEHRTRVYEEDIKKRRSNG